MSYTIHTLLISLLFLLPYISKGQVSLNDRGHSHNDYEQNRPLFDALKLRYISIEVDIHPRNSELIVSHTRTKLGSKKTLQELYLNPLDSIIRRKKGTVFSNDSTSLILMIDFKSRKKKAFDLLATLLGTYEHLFYRRINGIDSWGPIQILLSGNPPLKKLEELRSPYLFIDGRIGKKYSDYQSSMISRVSTPFHKVSLSSSKKSKLLLHNLIKSAHANNRKVRLWSVPNNSETWLKLLKMGLDFISVDDLQDFDSVYRQDH